MKKTEEVDLHDFKKVLKCYRLKVTERECEELFNNFSTKSTHKTNYVDLLSAIIVLKNIKYVGTDKSGKEEHSD